MKAIQVVFLAMFSLASMFSTLAAETFPSGSVTEVTTLDGERRALGDVLRYAADPEGRLAVTDVLDPTRIEWQHSDNATLNLGVTPLPHWFSLTLANPSAQDAARLIELSYGLLDYVDFYVVHDGALVQTVKTGDQRPMSERPLYHRNFLFPVKVPAEDKVQVLLRVQTEGSLQLPIKLWDLKAFYEHDQVTLSAQILFVGVMLALALYNAFLLLATRDWSYLWYVLSILSITVVVLSFHGITAQFLWPNRPQFNNPTLVAAISTNVFAASLFAYSFLGLGRYGKRIRWPLLVLTCSGVVVFALNFVLPYNLATRLAALISVTGASWMILVGAYLWYKGEILARFYTTAWLLLLVGSVLITFSKFGVLPHHFLLEHAQQMGAVAEGLLLSFALAYRMNLERKRRFLAQSELLRVQQEANEVLELRVKERTCELEAANQKLLEANAVDGLTQVKNRRFFEQMLNHEWSKNTRGPSEMSLLMIDGDHFKQVNDTYGHLCGDACLQHLAQIYQSSVSRAGDFVARYGGEEFAVLLCNSNLKNAALIAERIRQNVASTPFEWEGHQLALTVSIGVSSCVPQPFDDMKVLVKEADEALYAAKGAGRNRVMMYRKAHPDGAGSEIVPFLQAC